MISCSAAASFIRYVARLVRYLPGGAEGHQPQVFGQPPACCLRSIQRIAESERLNQEPEGERVAPRVVADPGVAFLWSQKPLRWDVALSPALYFQRRARLYVAIPVGPLSPAGEHNALPGGRVVGDHLQHRLVDTPGLASPVGPQED